MRFLCLHGQGSNAAWHILLPLFSSAVHLWACVAFFRPPLHTTPEKTNVIVRVDVAAGLRYALRDDRHDFVFIEGSHPCEAALGLRESFPEQSEFFQYFGGGQWQGQLRTATSELYEALAAEEPPFDGIIGFSQGAMLAATAIANRRQAGVPRFPALKLAVFMCCSFMPINSAKQRDFEVAKDGHSVFDIPTLHVYGAKDPTHFAAIEMSRLCEPSLRTVYGHPGGHEVPRSEKVTENLAKGFRECVRRATSRM